MVPFGATRSEVFRYVTSRLNCTPLQTVFDVGAHEGAVAVEMLAAFPQATVYAFEPGRQSFHRLAELGRKHPRIIARRCGLSDRSAVGRLVCLSDTKMAKFSDDDGEAVSGERVELTTGDLVADELRLSSVDYLKVDTEGYDLKVLKGFRALLSESRIRIIEVECAIGEADPSHVILSVIQRYLECFNYRIFCIFEQVDDSYFSGSPFLRRANVLFISARTVDENTRQRLYARRWERS